MLSVADLRAGYGPRPVLQGLRFEVRAGEIVALLGRNGAGRSTALKALIGLVRPAGSVRWQGRELAGLRPFEIARAGLGYVPETRDVFPRLTVRQNLLLGRKPGGRAAPRWTPQALYDMFPALGERAGVDAGALSGGEQQMLALCRALMGEPQLLLVDEPAEGLAPRMVEQVAQALQRLRREGVAVLVVEQKLSMALPLADRCLVMGEGRIVFEGTPQALQGAPDVRQEWLEV